MCLHGIAFVVECIHPQKLVPMPQASRNLCCNFCNLCCNLETLRGKTMGMGMDLVPPETSRGTGARRRQPRRRRRQRGRGLPFRQSDSRPTPPCSCLLPWQHQSRRCCPSRPRPFKPLVRTTISQAVPKRPPTFKHLRNTLSDAAPTWPRTIQAPRTHCSFTCCGPPSVGKCNVEVFQALGAGQI